MWGNFLLSSDTAKERIASALERTGDALTKGATDIHIRARKAKEQREKQQEEGGTSERESQIAETAGDATEESGSSANANNTNRLPVARFKSLRQNLANNFDKQKQEDMLDSLRVGWGSVLSVTKNVVESTREAVEKEQTRIQASLFQKSPYRRDPSLSLDKEALRDAEVVYITDRLITMGHPAMQSAVDGDITPERKLAAIGHLLDRRHNGRYMVWNLSELEYEYSVLSDQVMAFQFPGSPSPPLGLLLKILLSIESWLKADSRNVAVLHCLTGRGRTSTVLAAFLCWTGEAGFSDPNVALEYIAECRRLKIDELTIPSQRRYASYFSNMLDGVRPSQPPLVLKRIIASEAPKFGKRPPPESNDDDDDEENNSTPTSQDSELGCAPYLQLFKGGKLVFTTAASMSYTQSKDDLPFCTPSDGPISFSVETIVQGDILVRCRHLSSKGQRISMFRAAFHTGYIPPKVLRLTKAQLDGACSDDRFSDDFFIDFIFEACDASMASKHLLSSPDEEEEAGIGTGINNVNNDGKDPSVKFKDASAEGQNNTVSIHNEAAARRMMGTVVGAESMKGGVTVTASAYDSMLHRDSRFWDVISERRDLKMKATSAAISDSKGGGATDTTSSVSAYCGPTIGRRREFSKGGARESNVKATSGNSNNSSRAENETSMEAPQNDMQSQFSIGGEFDFMVSQTDPENVEKDPSNVRTESSSENPLPPKKDDLMEALMALEDDAEIDSPPPSPKKKNTVSKTDEDAEQEIIFESDESAEEEGNGEVLALPSLKGNFTESNVAKEDGSNLQMESKEVEVEEIDKDGGAGSKSSKDSSVQIVTKEDVMDDFEDEDYENDEVMKKALEEAGESFDFDDDDEELEDLENFLTKASEK